MEMFAYDDPAGAKPATASQPVAAALAEFGPEEWAALKEFAAERRYRPGARILPSEDPTPALHILMEGGVQLGGGDTVLGPGAMFNVSAFFDAASPGMTAATRGGAAVLLLTASGLNQMAAWRPRAGILLLSALGGLLARQLRDLGKSF
jgi:hypothetical protein